MPKKQINHVLLNSREAAFQLDMSPDNVNLLARNNELPGVKVGRQWRFKRRDITTLKKRLEKERVEKEQMENRQQEAA